MGVNKFATDVFRREAGSADTEERCTWLVRNRLRLKIFNDKPVSSILHRLSTWRCLHLLRSAGAPSRQISICHWYAALAVRSAANQPHGTADVDRRDRQTDGRTDGRTTDSCIDPTPHVTRAASLDITISNSQHVPFFANNVPIFVITQNTCVNFTCKVNGI